jgi:NitT/TauT family transport system substrate-binding protein
MMRRFFGVLLGALLLMAVELCPAQAAETIRIGYIPVLGSSALFVLDGKGWAKDAGLDVELVRFTSGPQAIQALTSGRIDGYVAGVLPLLQARAHGVDVKVVAAASIEELSVVARGKLASELPKDATNALTPASVKAALERFATEDGHPARIAAQPPGSVPDTVLRYWLKKQLGFADPAKAASIVGVGIDAAQQAFLAGAVDAVVLREPALTVVEAKVPDLRVLATGHDMMPDQPGSVLALVKPDAADHQAWARTLTALFVRATTLLAQHPDEAVPYVQTALGGGMLDDAVLKKALERSASSFISDPSRIVAGVTALQNFEVELGLLRKAEPVSDLFDQTVWWQAP